MTRIPVVATVWAMARAHAPVQRPKSAAATRSRKTEMLRVRVSEDQKAAMEAAAAREGLDLSNWLRQLALRAAGLLPAALSGEPMK